MWFAASVASVMFLAAPPQTSVDPSVQIEVAVRSYGPDGRVGGSASGPISATAANNIWTDTTTCSMGGGTIRPVATPSTIVWTSTGRIIQHTGDEYVVELDVHRLDAGPSTPLTLTLHLNEPTVLEEVGPTGNRCAGRVLRLEATVVPVGGRRVAAGSGGGRGTAGSGVSNAGAGPRATGSGVAAGGLGNGSGGVGGGTAAAAAAGEWQFTPVDSTFAAAFGPLIGGPTEQSVLAIATASSGSAAADATTVELRPLSMSLLAEMWLVYKTPDGVEHTLTRFGHVNDVGETFRFGLLSIRKADGSPLAVSVGINLRPMSTREGRSVLRAAIARIVNSRGAASAQGVGVSNRAIPMPGKDDVVSFEIPAMGGDQDVLAGYHFEIRVRVTPGGTP